MWLIVRGMSNKSHLVLGKFLLDSWFLVLWFWKKKNLSEFLLPRTWLFPAVWGGPIRSHPTVSNPHCPLVPQRWCARPRLSPWCRCCLSSLPLSSVTLDTSDPSGPSWPLCLASSSSSQVGPPLVKSAVSICLSLPKKWHFSHDIIFSRYYCSVTSALSGRCDHCVLSYLGGFFFMDLDGVWALWCFFFYWPEKILVISLLHVTFTFR